MQRRQAHGQLREKIVEGDGKGEVQAMNQECAIHNGRFARRLEERIMPG